MLEHSQSGAKWIHVSYGPRNRRYSDSNYQKSNNRRRRRRRHNQKNNLTEMKTKTKVSPYIKVRRNLFNSNEMAELMTREGATGAGTYIIICCYLCTCENAVGSMLCIGEVAARCHKSKKYITHIITDFGLFDVNGDMYTSKLVQKNINIAYSVSGDTEDEDTPDGGETCAAKSTQLQQTSDTVATDLQQSSIPPHLLNGRRRGRTYQKSIINNQQSFVVVDTPTKDIAAAAEIPTTKTEHFSDEGHHKNGKTAARDESTENTDIGCREEKILAQLAADTQYIANIAAVDGIDIDRNAAHLDFALRLWADSSKANGVICTEKPLTLGEAKAKFLKWTGNRVYRNWEETEWKKQGRTAAQNELPIVEVPEYARQFTL